MRGDERGEGRCLMVMVGGGCGGRGSVAIWVEWGGGGGGGVGGVGRGVGEG